MSDIKVFIRELDEFADSIGVRTETVIKKISLQTFIGIVRKTPVDTGRARASWVIGVETPQSSPNISESQTFSASEANQYALKELADLNQIKPFSRVFISNSLPYIVALEDGSSKQAPQGMVEVTLTEVERDLKRITDDF